MGYGGIAFLYMPMAMMDTAKMIEDEGSEAIPQGQFDNWRSINSKGELIPQVSRPVAPGRAAPDVSVHLRIVAFLAGLGEIWLQQSGFNDGVQTAAAVRDAADRG